MSAEPFEQWRQRLRDAFRLNEALTQARDDAARLRRLSRAEALRAAAKRREALFGAELFAEPTFDLLLDIYTAAHRAPGSAPAIPGCAAGARSANWRYVAVLRQRGLVEAERAGEDPRFAQPRLTPEAMEAMDQFLDGVRIAEPC